MNETSIIIAILSAFLAGASIANLLQKKRPATPAPRKTEKAKKSNKVTKHGKEYSKKEDALILKVKNMRQLNQLAKDLGRSASAVQTRRSVLSQKSKEPKRRASKFIRVKSKQPWTAAEDKYLMDNLGRRRKVLAGALDRTPAAITQRIAILRKSGQYNSNGFLAA